MHETERSRERGLQRARVRVALAAGLALVAIAVCLTLTRHPLGVTEANGVTARRALAVLPSGTSVCQGGESLPQNTYAIRLSLFALVGPSVTVHVSSKGRALTQGTRGTGWTAGAVTIPVARLRRSHSDVTVCASIARTIRAVVMVGQRTVRGQAATGQGRRLRGRMRIEYLRPDKASWWSSIVPVARRMGLGHAPAGSWIALLAAALMLSVCALACRLMLTNPLDGTALRVLGGVPRAAWACALIACLNAVSWSLVTPLFQATDEPDHYAYVELLAENGRLPKPGAGRLYSSQESRALADLHAYEVRQDPAVPTIATAAQQRRLERGLAAPLSQTNGAPGVSASEPPLYYALEAIPFYSSDNVLTRLELMRLLSAVLAGLTALFTVLFLRESLPRVPWAWTVGGLGVSLAPLLGFVSGTLTPDAMLATVSAALFYCIARGLRRGLSPSLALAIGSVMAVGFLTKLNFIGLAPGAILGLAVLAMREARKSTARAVRALLLALTIAGAPVAVYVLVNVLSGDPALGFVSKASHRVQGSVLRELSYIWQLYLPRLPGMADYFPGVLSTRVIWFDRVIGFYGWLDTVFPGWVYTLALLPAALIGVLGVRTLVACRSSLRARAIEPVIYAAMAAGVLALVGVDSYIHSSETVGELYAEPRYLLPMAALMAAVLVIAARGAGRRWQPVAGVLIVTAVLASDVFSQLQVIARYYG